MREAQGLGMPAKHGLGVAARMVVDSHGAVGDEVSGGVVMVDSTGVVVGTTGLVKVVMGSSGVVVG